MCERRRWREEEEMTEVKETVRKRGWRGEAREMNRQVKGKKGRERRVTRI